MGIPFEMIGKLTLGKESEKFKPYEEISYEKSGWVNRILKFNVLSGDNRHMLMIKGGSFADEHGLVYLFSKKYKNAEGQTVKGSKFTIPFKERLTSKKLEEVAEFKKFVVDLEAPNRRYQLEKAVEKIKEGTSLTDEELKNLGIEAESQAEDELTKSKKRRKEFVAEWDFVDYIHRLISSGKFANKKFKIHGEIKHTYSAEKQRYYTNITPNRIYLANDSDKECSTATIELLYNKDSLDDGSVDEKGRYFVNGYVFDYDNNLGKEIPCPITLSLVVPDENVDKKAKKAFNMYIKQFTVEDDSWKQLGIVAELVNGSQKVEIDESMLTEFQQEMILLGELSLDDIRKELGGSIYGDKIIENKFLKLARGYSKGREDTIYTDERFIITLENEDKSDDVFNEDDDDDIFN